MGLRIPSSFVGSEAKSRQVFCLQCLMARKPSAPLRRGWTTGACATAATKAAWTALLTGEFPDPVRITLPKGQQPAFALATERLDADSALAGIVKDAGDDPDVTHRALIRSQVRRAGPGEGVAFRAGPGVGTVTLPGLPVEVGEPAINPVPRRMMRAVVEEVAARAGVGPDAIVEVSDHQGAHGVLQSVLDFTHTTSSGIGFGYHQMCTCARLSTDMAVGARSSPSAPPDARRPRAGLGEILTLAEVAEYLKISMKTAYGMARSDDFPAFKAGKHWRVPRAELGAWVARRSQRSRGQAE